MNEDHLRTATPLDLPPEVREIYEEMLRVGVGGYLTSERFEALLDELGLSSTWASCERWTEESADGETPPTSKASRRERVLGAFLALLHTHGDHDAGRFVDAVVDDLGLGW